MPMSRYRKILSIIIPLTNSIKEIDDLLEVFLDSSPKQRSKFEVIMIDDGSTDDTYKYVTKFYTKFSDLVKIYKQKAKGEGGVLNTALHHCGGKYVKILRPQDRLEKDAFSKILTFIEANSYELVINGWEMANIDLENTKKPFESKDFETLPRGEVQSIPARMKLDHKNMIYLKEIFVKHNFQAMEDVHFSDSYTTVWFMKHATSFYDISDLVLHKQTINHDTQKDTLEKYVNHENDFWKVVSAVITNIEPLNKNTQEAIIFEIYRLSLFDLALVSEKDAMPWKERFTAMMPLMEKNVYLFDDYSKSHFAKLTKKGKSRAFKSYASRALQHLDELRML